MVGLVVCSRWSSLITSKYYTNVSKCIIFCIDGRFGGVRTLVKSHYMERQIGSISLPPYGPQARLRNVQNLAFSTSSISQIHQLNTDYFGH